MPARKSYREIGAMLGSAAVSAVMLALAFPRPHITILVLAALVPLFYFWEGKSRLMIVISAMTTGALFNLILLYWIITDVVLYGGLSRFLGGITLILLALFVSLYWGLFGLAVSFFQKRPGYPAALPFLWVLVEYLRTYTVMAFPWGSLGYTLARYPVFLQLSEVTGIYGLSFIIVCSNTAIYETVRFYARKRSKFPKEYIAAALGLWLLCLGYGLIRMPIIEKRMQNAEARSFKAAVIQGNIEQGLKWDENYRAETIKIHADLTRQAAAEGAKLVVWPETAAPFNFRTDFFGRHFMFSLADETKTSLLFGSPTYRIKDGRYSYYNSAFLVAPNKAVLGEYDKVHLVPFGEFVPLKKVLFFVEKMTEGVGDFSSGDKLNALAFPPGDLGVLICFEGILPALARAEINNGSKILVNITNDAWFGKTSAPYQHLEMSVLRAVENRVFVLRAANTGVSAVIDPVGRIRKETGIFASAAVIEKVTPGPFGSIYAKVGDAFVLLCGLFALIILAGGMARNGKNRH